MERGSDKHSPRADDELAHEVQGMMKAGRSTHMEEWNDPEPSGEDQPDVDRDPEGTLQGAVPDGMTADDVEMRSALAQVLGKSVYPATGTALVARARENDATDDVLQRLAQLPSDQTFQNVQDVWMTLGGGVEEHRF
jgi:hypothetical protein